jgi:hypothetical protein
MIGYGSATGDTLPFWTSIVNLRDLAGIQAVITRNYSCCRQHS